MNQLSLEPPPLITEQPRPVFLTAEWRWLAMLNYEIDPALLLPYVPRGTELDLYQGRALVSMVGFVFENTRLLGWRVPGHQNFEEVNLRFYIRRQHPAGERRAVAFIKEIVPRAAVTAVARWVYHENYATHAMRRRIAPPIHDQAGQVEYSWRVAGRWNSLGVTVAGQPRLAPLDSEAAFITEHYWGYTRQPAGGTMEYAVEHPRWNVWNATDARLDCDVKTLYGGEFAAALSAPPSSALLADGSSVTVRRGCRLVASALSADN